MRPVNIVLKCYVGLNDLTGRFQTDVGGGARRIRKVSSHTEKVLVASHLIISAAGPLSNLTAALIAYVAIQLLKILDPNLLIGGGGGIHTISFGIFLILYYIVVINIILAIFNLIPIPPLDGSGVLMGLLSDESAQKYEQIRPYGFLILIILIMTGLIGRILGIILKIVK